MLHPRLRTIHDRVHDTCIILSGNNCARRWRLQPRRGKRAQPQRSDRRRRSQLLRRSAWRARAVWRICVHLAWQERCRQQLHGAAYQRCQPGPALRADRAARHVCCRRNNARNGEGHGLVSDIPWEKLRSCTHTRSTRTTTSPRRRSADPTLASPCRCQSRRLVRVPSCRAH